MVFSLRSIRREIRESEELTKQRIEQRQKDKEAKLSKPAVLGRYKYEEPPIEVNMSDEIAGTLRGLKTDGQYFFNLFVNSSASSHFFSNLGNVLVDRYKSLQRRNIIEPRLRQRVVYRYKHKVFTKRSYVEPTGVRIGRTKQV